MTTRAKKTKDAAAKKPTETTWEELPRKQREKLARLQRRVAKTNASLARLCRKSALGYERRGLPVFARNTRTEAERCDQDAAQRSALADLIERNLGGAK